MFASFYALLLIFLPISTTAQSNATVLCIAGQCLQGYSNTTLGAKLSTPGVATPIQLLPGQYTSTTSPQLLHNVLTNPSTTISSSPGFTNSSSLSLPLDLALQAGLSIFSGTLYSGQAGFSSLPTSPFGNKSTPLTASSLALSSNVWIAMNSSSNNRVIVWNAIPDVSQLPSSDLGSLSLTDIQSSACSPNCASSGVCTAEGTCQCPSGFTGASCESCSSGFFGPTCRACPSNCEDCDDGINGSGRCITPQIINAPSTCNCLNGVCGSNGQCTCSAGFTTASNGTACAQCSPGFFLTSTGDCQICQLGCTECAAGTGTCTTCKQGFSQDGNDPTKCDPLPSTTTSGQVCPDGSFSNGASCTPCSSACQTCSGASSSDCTLCASGSFTLNGTCVTANSDGVCTGTNLIADNNKRECDSCGAKCTSCQIPNFNVASTVNQKQCTGCIPGFFLSNGSCVSSCPTGTTVSSQDNLTCLACASSCTTCAGSTSFCLSCPNNQLASGGKCVSTCPLGTFSASGSCLTCHPDCSSCSGGAFNQCTSCPSNRPVLTNGRCLPTCSQSQFFDTSSTCQACDSSCSSCSGSGPSNCLSCSSSTQVLRAGTCVAANCQSSSNVIAGLGVCLSELVSVATPSGTAAPLPSITGLDSPTIITKRRSLAWWEILLMTLGCAFIFLVIVWLFRRRQKKKRGKRTALFAAGAPPNRGRTSWRWRLIRFGEKLFGHNRSRRVPIVHLGPSYEEPEDIKLAQLRDAEEARLRSPIPLRPGVSEEDMVKLIASYNRPASPPQSRYNPIHTRLTAADQQSISDASSQHSAPSLYSQMTGMPRRGPDPRQPMRMERELKSKFSATTLGSEYYRDRQPGSSKFWK